MKKMNLVITAEKPNKDFCFAGKVFIHKSLLSETAYVGMKIVALVDNTKKGLQAKIVGQTNIDKYLSIIEKWNKLVLENTNYVCVGSCNNDISQYLCEIGTENEISYFGKPNNSYRISDHWNWINPNKAPNVIQCELDGVNTPNEPYKCGCKELHIAKYVNGKYYIIA